MSSIALAMLLTGLTGGFGHCIGMCGPVVAAFSLGDQAGGWIRHILFNLGRVTTYTILGGFAGLSGSFIILAASIETLQKAVLAFAGFAIILMGLAAGEWVPLKKGIGSCNPVLPAVGKIMRIFESPGTAGSYYPMGIVIGFLPCGLSYTALLAAARASMEAENRISAILTGAFMMFLFGAGTAPALILLGKTMHRIGEKSRKGLYRIASIIMILTGLTFILSALK
ncbi:MAG: sulfite exporter TauE/SafE family protein [Chlorobiaceae bacterium]|nr:sulfite exporter TauE/SafE family protein [Chlorobiaceae bacterium]NTV60465.1 sulfite exporter TauE/SafE family protein [Chlorobiaceae bacterium]